MTDWGGASAKAALYHFVCGICMREANLVVCFLQPCFCNLVRALDPWNATVKSIFFPAEEKCIKGPDFKPVYTLVKVYLQLSIINHG